MFPLSLPINIKRFSGRIAILVKTPLNMSDRSFVKEHIDSGDNDE